jgi:small-conductance mechanosensitive channel
VLSAALALVAIGFFAVWSVLSNLLCALMLVVVKPFRVGDSIEVCGDGLKGKVIDLNFAFVTLREEEGALIRVPNNQFFQKSIRCEAGEERTDLAEQLTADQPKE